MGTEAKPTLCWSAPMSSSEAESYHRTAGFVAVELWRHEYEQRRKLEKACEAKDSAIRKAMEWNWLDDECEPPEDVIVQINRALATPQADEGDPGPPPTKDTRVALRDYALEYLAKRIADASVARPTFPVKTLEDRFENVRQIIDREIFGDLA